MDAKKLEKELARYESWREQLKFRNTLFNLFGRGIYHPIYGRKDLTSQEKDEIMLAYDWQQVGKSLKSVIG